MLHSVKPRLDVERVHHAAGVLDRKALPPTAPWRLISARLRSFAVTPGGRRPSNRTRIVAGRCTRSVPVASACSASVEPMPQANAPIAPCVQVWLSGQTTVAPGSTIPSSGGDHVHDALVRVAHVEQVDASLERRSARLGDERLAARDARLVTAAGNGVHDVVHRAEHAPRDPRRDGPTGAAT